MTPSPKNGNESLMCHAMGNPYIEGRHSVTFIRGDCKSLDSATAKDIPSKTSEEPSLNQGHHGIDAC